MIIMLSLYAASALANDSVPVSFVVHEASTQVDWDRSEVTHLDAVSELYEVILSTVETVTQGSSPPLRVEQQLVSLSTVGHYPGNPSRPGLEASFHVGALSAGGPHELAIAGSGGRLFAERLVVATVLNGGDSGVPEEHQYWRHYMRQDDGTVQTLSLSEWDALVDPLQMHVDAYGATHYYRNGVPDGETTGAEWTSAELDALPRDIPAPATDR